MLIILDFSNFGAYSAKSAREWLSVLRVAHTWGFASIHRLALSHLEHLVSPIDKLVCARNLGAPCEWAIDAYTQLCVRDSALSLEECRTLGFEEIACVHDAWRAVAKGQRDVRAVVEEKLRAHGLLTGKVEVPAATSPLPDPCSQVVVAPANPDAYGPSSPVYNSLLYGTCTGSSQPYLDIRDDSNHIVEGYPSSDHAFVLQGWPGPSLKLDGHKVKLPRTSMMP